jgi:hypothetical protein
MYSSQRLFTPLRPRSTRLEKLSEAEEYLARTLGLTVERSASFSVCKSIETRRPKSNYWAQLRQSGR